MCMFLLNVVPILKKNGYTPLVMIDYINNDKRGSSTPFNINYTTKMN